MIRTIRAGAIASAGLLFASFMGAGIAGAMAQEQTGQDMAASTPANSEATAGDAQTGQSDIRFVAHEVVQPLPETGAQTDPADAGSLRELVTDMTASADSGMKLSPELSCLAKAVYFESRGENLAGQLAVAEVVINRTQSSQFPDDYCAVITQPAQFSFVRHGHIPTPRTSSPAWQRARAIARIAHRDLWQTAAADALYFHAKRVNPRWSHRKVLAATIDRHIFYK